MQIIKAEVTPVELSLNHSVIMAGAAPIDRIMAVFVRLDTRQGQSAWGCTVSHPSLIGDESGEVLNACLACADMATGLHPTQIEYSLALLEPLVDKAPTAMCAFDLAFHDLLGLAAGMPLYRILGGYRHSIMTSATIPVCSVKEGVDYAQKLAASGFKILKVKGGLNSEEDVSKVRSINRSLPYIKLRLDADGGYTVEQALEVSRALSGKLEMIEQPVPANELEGLRLVKRHSTIPVFADQSITGLSSALTLASENIVDGLSIKMVSCGGFRCAKQIVSIAQAAHLAAMVSCLIEPSILVAAGLHFSLSSSVVRYGDLDGHLDLQTDPSIPGFRLQEGSLYATDIPGLGCKVDL